MSEKILQEELKDELFERLDDSEKNAEKIAYESRTYLADAWHRFQAEQAGVCGLLLSDVHAAMCHHHTDGIPLYL